MSRSPHHALAALGFTLTFLPATLHAATLEAPTGVTAAPGDTLAVAITLRTMGQVVVATQNDLGFGSRTPVIRLPNDAPDCFVNPAIDKEAALFAFQPPGCGTTTPCTGVRAVVVSLANLDPIPDGAVVYTCRIAVPSTAPAGTDTLSVDDVVLVDEEANEIPGAAGTDGSVVVSSAPTPTPTLPPTATPTPTGTPTATTPPTATATAPPTDTPVMGACGGDCNDDGSVAINELIIGVSIALGALPVDTCPSFAGPDGQVGITDLIAAVSDALSGC